MNIRHLTLLILVSLMPSVAHGRRVPLLSYEELTAKADLIVIVRSFKTRDAGDGDPIIKMKRGEEYLTAVVTELRVLATLKGELKSKKLLLPHYRIDRAKSERNGLQGWANGPTLIEFTQTRVKDEQGFGEPNKNDVLLFLVETDGGALDFVTGQFDPKYSVFSLSP